MRSTDVLVIAWFVLLGGGAGCGSDVATCESICASADDGVPALGGGGTSSTDGVCASSCTATADACAAAGLAATFQDYLTCVGNAGGLQPTDYESSASRAAGPLVVCATQAAAVNSGCGDGE
jgi:hypothetical protein